MEFQRAVPGRESACERLCLEPGRGGAESAVHGRAGGYGCRDPFGLRRAALGVLRLLMERQLPLELQQLIQWSAGTFPAGTLEADFAPGLMAFITDRLRNLLKDQGEPQDVVEAV